MKGYSFKNTICLYAADEETTKTVISFASSVGNRVFFAEDETDLIAVPCWLAVFDGRWLSKGLEDFLLEAPEENETLLLSCTEPKKKMMRFTLYPEQLTEGYFYGLWLKKINF